MGSLDEKLIAEALQGEGKKKCIVVAKRSFEEGHILKRIQQTVAKKDTKLRKQFASALLGQINMSTPNKFLSLLWVNKYLSIGCHVLCNFYGCQSIAATTHASEIVDRPSSWIHHSKLSV
jgi:hypothetical protein